MHAPVLWRHRLAVLPLLFAPAGLTMVAAGHASAQAIAPGFSAPEIDLPTLAGGRVKLSALRGHPVVVTFWGTWCPPCREEFPELVAAHRRYREAGLEVLAVNQQDQEIRQRDVEDFVKQFGVEFTIGMDQRGKSRRSFRLLGLPTTVFIDSAGIIRKVSSGPLAKQELARGLTLILSREANPPE